MEEDMASVLSVLLNHSISMLRTMNILLVTPPEQYLEGPYSSKYSCVYIPKYGTGLWKICILNHKVMFSAENCTGS